MSDNSNRLARGCLWLVLLLILTISVYGCLLAFGVKSGAVYFIALLICSWFVKRILKPKEEIGIKARNRSRALFALIVIVCFGIFLFQLGNYTEHIQPDFTEEDIVTTEQVPEGDTLIDVLSSARVWQDNDGRSYSGSLRVKKSDYERLKELSSQYSPSSYGNAFWGDLYDFLDRRSESSLELLFETFALIQQEKQLNQMEFAQMVTSCIQDIPYSLVFESACLSADEYDDPTISDVLRSCPECCVGNKSFGIQGPVEFIATLKGDCDTRTVLLYSVLKHFNYDVAILNSDFYRHSILGVNIPASGAYKLHRGKRYYLWETTAKYFKLGEMAPTMEDLSYWDIVLLSK